MWVQSLTAMNGRVGTEMQLLEDYSFILGERCKAKKPHKDLFLPSGQLVTSGSFSIAGEKKRRTNTMPLH